jgi:hypothetical protein
MTTFKNREVKSYNISSHEYSGTLRIPATGCTNFSVYTCLAHHFQKKCDKMFSLKEIPMSFIDFLKSGMYMKIINLISVSFTDAETK